MPAPTIPARVALRGVLAASALREHETHEKLHHNPRGPSPKTHGLRQALAVLTDQRCRLAELLAAKPKGEIDAALAGLLCAWATGHEPAAKDVEDRLEALRHPALEPVCQASHIVGACRILFPGDNNP